MLYNDFKGLFCHKSIIFECLYPLILMKNLSLHIRHVNTYLTYFSAPSSSALPFRVSNITGVAIKTDE